MARAAKPVKGVYEREPGVWCGRYRSADGKLVRKTFGVDRQAAIRWVEKARTIRHSGEGVLPDTATRQPRTFVEVERIGKRVTVGELCDDYLRHVKSLPTEYRDQINPPRYVANIRAAFGDLQAESLRPAQIRAWLLSFQSERGLANASVNKIKAALSSVYRLGIEENDKVTTNPARSVKRLTPPSELPRFLSEDEETRLRRCFNTTSMRPLDDRNTRST